MHKMTRISVIAIFGGTLVACGGGGGGGGGSAGNSGPQASAEVTASNALMTAQVGTASVGGAGASGEEVQNLADTLGDLSGETPGSSALTTSSPAISPVSVSGCVNGTISAQALSAPGGHAVIQYTAGNCESSGGSIHDGTLTLTVGPWDEFDGGSESLIEMGENGFSVDACLYQGGFGIRSYSEVPQTPPNGNYLFVFEYGATADGFSRECPSGADVFFGPNSSVRNVLSYTVTGGVAGNITNTVSTGGQFEAPGTDGMVLFEATGLVYETTGSGGSQESSYADPGIVCPIAGSLVINGTNGSQVTVYFGSDAGGPGTAVQVIGPDGFSRNYSTCDDFRQDTP